MTTIAWDGKVLASDRRRTLFNTKMPATKIFRAMVQGRDHLIGCAGESCEAIAFREWVVRDQMDPEKKPRMDDVHILLVGDNGVIRVSDHRLQWIPIPLKAWAIGSGADFAMGAMYAGKDAKRAIEIASELDRSTGLGIDTLRFR